MNIVNYKVKMKRILTFIILIFILSSCIRQRVVRDFPVFDEDGEEYIDIDRMDYEADEIGREEKLKIAVLLPLSGKAKKIGDSMLQSSQIALFENRKNNAVIMPYDTKGTSFGAINAMNKAVEDNIDVVVGPLFSSSTKAVMDIAHNNKIPVFSFSNDQKLLNEKGVYLMGIIPEQEIERAVGYAISQGKYSFSALLPNNSYGALVAKIMKEAVTIKDGTVVKIEFYSPNDKMLNKKVMKLLKSYAIPERVYEEYEKEKELSKIEGIEEEVEFIVEEEDKIYADVILIPDTGPNLERILSLIKRYSPEDREYQLIGSGKWHSPSVYNDFNSHGAWFVATNPKGHEEFTENFTDTYGNSPMGISSLSYDVMKVIQKLYNKYGEINREDLLYYDGFEGTNGLFRFLPNGIVERQLAVLEIEHGYIEVIDSDFDKFLRY